MKRILWIVGLALLASLLLGALDRLDGRGALAAAEAAVPGKAYCSVCRVMHGEAEEEPVKATRVHDGVTYGFCSEHCAEEFDADPAAFLPPIFPRPAPALGLTTLAGDSLDWGALEDKVVLVDFWATWCKPCHKAMPELQALHDEYAERGFAVVGVSIDEDGSQKKVEKFIGEKKIRYPIALDSAENPAWARYRVKAVPAAFLVDAKGQIVAQWLGLPADTDEVEAAIQPLLKESSAAN